MEIMDPMPAVLAVLVVVGTALWWLRKKGGVRLLPKSARRSSRRLASIERLALSPHHVLHLVRLDDRLLLVAQSPAGLTPLDGALAASPAPEAAFRAAASERG
jgi:flagellar biogenesis protein FliO